jgi:hypothetical protein
MRMIERAAERAFRLPRRDSYRHSSKNAGEDAGMAGWKPAPRVEREGGAIRAKPNVTRHRATLP